MGSVDAATAGALEHRISNRAPQMDGPRRPKSSSNLSQLLSNDEGCNREF